MNGGRERRLRTRRGSCKTKVKKKQKPTWPQKVASFPLLLVGLASSPVRRGKMDASRAGLSSAASSSGRGCQHAAARPNGRSPASWRRCHQRRRGASCLVVTAAPSPSASSSPSPSSSSSSPEPQPLLPNWPHTPGARRMPQRMRRRGTGTALLSSSSLSTTPATTTSENAGDSSKLIGVETRFVAETLLPTRLGKFRLRGYLHTVRNDKRKIEWGSTGGLLSPTAAGHVVRSGTFRFDLSFLLLLPPLQKKTLPLK